MMNDKKILEELYSTGFDIIDKLPRNERKRKYFERLDKIYYQGKSKVETKITQMVALINVIENDNRNYER